MNKDKKKVFIKNFGCQMNVRDSEVIAGLMKQAGFVLVDDEAQADVVIFNTCSVRQHAEDKVWSEIGRITKDSRGRNRGHNRGHSPDRSVSGSSKAGTIPIIGLAGCMAQHYKQDAFERSPAIDFCAGPADIAQIPDIVTRIIAHRKSAKRGGLMDMKIWETDGSVRPEEIYHTGFYEEKDHAYVVTSEGCSNFCTYCIVPYVRGPVRHRRAGDILSEVTEAAAGGITRFTLLGQNVSSYHSPEPLKGKPVAFVDLLVAVGNIPGLKEVGFITSHPRDTTVRLFEAMASCDTVKKYLHLPVQSGSDRILKAMNRGYTVAEYIRLAKEYRRIVQGGLLSTDIIVGFPGETDDDFQATRDLVRDIGFDTGYIFKYSPRPNTKASMLADDVAPGEKIRRHKIILDLQKSISKSRKRSVA